MMAARLLRRLSVSACALLASATPALAGEEPVRIALTFDDLPAHGPLAPGETRIGNLARMVAALSEAGIPPEAVYGFVNGVALDEEAEAGAALDVWRAAGHRLANHTWSHANLDEAGLDAFQDEVIRNETVIAPRMAHDDWRWFRFPYLAEGSDAETRSAARAFLARRGYRIASVTMDFDDWAFTDPYVRCVEAGDPEAVARMEALYIEAARLALERSRAMSEALHGEDIPYVLLLHAGGFHARMLPALLAFYRDAGVEFIGLEDAQAHPFYGPDTAMTDTPERLSLEAALARAGLAPPARFYPAEELEGACR